MCALTYGLWLLFPLFSSIKSRSTFDFDLSCNCRKQWWFTVWIMCVCVCRCVPIYKMRFLLPPSACTLVAIVESKPLSVSLVTSIRTSNSIASIKRSKNEMKWIHSNGILFSSISSSSSSTSFTCSFSLHPFSLALHYNNFQMTYYLLYR